jgi:hypothetical protein
MTKTEEELGEDAPTVGKSKICRRVFITVELTVTGVTPHLARPVLL